MYMYVYIYVYICKCYMCYTYLFYERMATLLVGMTFGLDVP